MLDRLKHKSKIPKNDSLSTHDLRSPFSDQSDSPVACPVRVRVPREYKEQLVTARNPSRYLRAEIPRFQITIPALRPPPKGKQGQQA